MEKRGKRGIGMIQNVLNILTFIMQHQKVPTAIVVCGFVPEPTTKVTSRSLDLLRRTGPALDQSSHGYLSPAAGIGICLALFFFPFLLLFFSFF